MSGDENQYDDDYYDEDNDDFQYERSLLKTDEQKKIDELQAQLRTLQLIKEKNEEELKEALQQAINLKNNSRITDVEQKNREYQEWRQAIIEDELSKPIEVAYDYVRSRTEENIYEKHKLNIDIKLHIDNLQKLKDEINKRSEIKRLKVNYDKGRLEYLNDGPYNNKTENELKEAIDSVIDNLDRLVILESQIHNLETTAEELQRNAEERFKQTISNKLKQYSSNPSNRSNNTSQNRNNTSQNRNNNTYNNNNYDYNSSNRATNNKNNRPPLYQTNTNRPELYQPVQQWREHKKIQRERKISTRDKLPYKKTYPNSKQIKNDFEQTKKNYDKQIKDLKNNSKNRYNNSGTNQYSNTNNSQYNNYSSNQYNSNNNNQYNTDNNQYDNQSHNTQYQNAHYQRYK